MRCRVCNSEIDTGIAKCPKCGFPVLQMVKGDVAEEKKMNELAENFRKKKVETVSVQMVVYSNGIENDKPKVIKEDYILLAKGEQLLGHEIIWYPENFARLSGDCKLRVRLIRTNGESQDVDISVENPNIMDFWKIGVAPQDGMAFKIVLGSKKSYSSSEKISYL